MLSPEDRNNLFTRFPYAEFDVGCFQSIKEVDTKPLSYFPEIIYCHEYNEKIPVLEGGYHIRSSSCTYYIIKRKNNQNCIRVCDVIDFIIEYELPVDPIDDTLVDITRIDKSLVSVSVPVFSARWAELHN